MARPMERTWTDAARSSIRRERISPPCGLGAKSPVSRCCARQRAPVDGATPNRATAARMLNQKSRLEGISCRFKTLDHRFKI